MNAIRTSGFMAAALAASLALPAAAQTQSNPPRTPTLQSSPAAASEATAANLFKDWDADHNGVLSQREFVSGWSNVRHRVEAVEQRLAAQFKAVDVNRDGGIDAAEYANLQVVRQAGKAAPPLQAFDANHDQRLQFGEYVAMLRRAAAAAGPQHPTPQPALPSAPDKR